MTLYEEFQQLSDRIEQEVQIVEFQIGGTDKYQLIIYLGRNQYDLLDRYHDSMEGGLGSGSKRMSMQLNDRTYIRCSLPDHIGIGVDYYKDVKVRMFSGILRQPQLLKMTKSQKAFEEWAKIEAADVPVFCLRKDEAGNYISYRTSHHWFLWKYAIDWFKTTLKNESNTKS